MYTNYASDIARLVFGYLSEKGLEETKNAFSKESPDLLERNLDKILNEGPKLSLIIEEYLVLRTNDEKANSADPESMLLLLWKQFDVLVGQLKHTTIPSPKKDQPKVQRGFSQRARMRELNKSNWLKLQQKKNRKSLSLVNHDVFNTPKPINIPIKSPQHSTSKTSATPKYVQITPNPLAVQLPYNVPVNPLGSQSSYDVPVNPLGPQSPHNVAVHHLGPQSLHNVAVHHLGPQSPHKVHVIGPESFYNVVVTNERLCAEPPVWKTPTKNIPRVALSHCASASPFAVPNARVVQSNVISESIQEVSTSKQLHSYNEQLLPVDQLKSPKRKSVPPKKRTGEALAALPSGAQVTTKANGVNSTPTLAQDDSQHDIQSIVEKILGRPELPEKLAENINRAVEIDGPTSQQSGYSTEEENIAQTQSAVHVLDGNKVKDILEMMKSDPVFEELFSSFESFESYEESDAGQAKDSEPAISSKPSSFHNEECANVALDALLMLACSPVRPQSSGSLETPPRSNASPLIQLHSPSVPSTNPATVILSPGNLNSEKRPLQPLIAHVRQLNFTCGTSPGTLLGGNKCKGSIGKCCRERNSEDKTSEDKRSGGKSSEDKSSEEKCSEVISKGQLSKVFVNEGVVGVGEKKTLKEGTSKKELMKTNAEMNTGKCAVKETSDKVSQSVISVLEDSAANALLECQTKTVLPKETPLKASHEARKGYLVERKDKEGCDRTTDVMLCEATNSTATKSSDELTSLTEGFTNIKTPGNCGKGLCSSTNSDKTSKRKKKKKSSRTSKKAKIIPDDLDVDKFLARLHYAEEKT